MNHRYLLCLLICALLLYFALPRLSPQASGLEGAFAISWLAFALLVLAGNLSALLFPPKERQALDRKVETPSIERKRMRG